MPDAPRLGRLAAATLTALLIGACSFGRPSDTGPLLTPVVPAGLAGRLVYTRDSALWALGLSDGRSQQIVAPPETGQVISARFSPDGTQVAYAMFELKERRYTVGEVYLTAPDGSGNRKIIAAEQPNTVYQFPIWGPSGTDLYVMHLGQQASERVRQIEHVNLVTNERTPVTDASGPFDVSADGRWLAIVRTSSAGNNLTVLDLQSGQSRVLIPDGPYELIGAPRFDPSGQTVLFSAPSPATSLLPRGSGLDLGAWLGPAVAAAHGPPQDVYAIPLAGGQVRRLTNFNADEPVTAWSPDGKFVAVLSFEGLSAIPAGGGPPQPILRPGGYGAVDWAR